MLEAFGRWKDHRQIIVEVRGLKNCQVVVSKAHIVSSRVMLRSWYCCLPSPTINDVPQLACDATLAAILPADINIIRKSPCRNFLFLLHALNRQFKSAFLPVMPLSAASGRFIYCCLAIR